MEFLVSRGMRDLGLPFSDAVRVGGMLILSGQIGNPPGRLELVPGGIEAETRQMMDNIAHVLNAAGRSFDDVFKCTVMLADMNEWVTFNRVYTGYFRPDRLPARSAFAAKALALGARVEMECWAWGGDRAET
ncbi:MAG TPA: Rid family hydrolase [Rhizomicrobium sp.]|jgi:reactive intermediate/imine deaminase|nr:Rid family hydrolase [Rhizomicrobium sp.]